MRLLQHPELLLDRRLARNARLLIELSMLFSPSKQRLWPPATHSRAPLSKPSSRRRTLSKNHSAALPAEAFAGRAGRPQVAAGSIQDAAALGEPRVVGKRSSDLGAGVDGK